MSEDNCRFELPKGWKEDTVYTKWVEVLTIRIEEKLISEFLEDLERNCICWDGSQTERNVLKLKEKWEKRLKV